MAIVAPVLQQDCENLNRLAESHVVGKTGAESEVCEEIEPLHSCLLVRTEGAS